MMCEKTTHFPVPHVESLRIEWDYSEVPDAVTMVPLISARRGDTARLHSIIPPSPFDDTNDSSKSIELLEYEHRFLNIVDLSFMEDDGTVTFVDICLKRWRFFKELPSRLAARQVTQGFLEILRVRSP